MMPFLRKSPDEGSNEREEEASSSSNQNGSSSFSSPPSGGPGNVRFGNGFGNGNSESFSSASGGAGRRRMRWDEGVEANASNSSRSGSRASSPRPGGSECRTGEQLAVLLMQLKTLIAMAIATLCGIGLITLLGILSITIRPFSKPTYRRLSATLAASAFLDVVALLAPDMSLCLTGDSDVPNPVGASVLVSNHLINGDWWAMLMLGRCIGLRGSMKVFLRNEMLQGVLSTTSNRGDGGGSSPKASLTNESGINFNWLSPRNANTHASIPNGSSHESDGSFAGNSSEEGQVPVAVSLGGHLLHKLLEFPLLSAESSSQNWVQDRSDLLTLLRSFADDGAPAPVQLLLYPEGWSLEGERDRRAAMAKSAAFAKREGRPQLKHLLLPRTKGFNACLESLRESNPVIYDVTMAYRGYDGKAPMTFGLSWPSLWDIIRGQLPTEIHFRIKRHSLGAVVGDSQWLDKQWKEKDRMLTHFAKYQQFPTDQRGYGRQRIFHTQAHSVESSLMSMARLGIIPFMIPLILFLSIPIAWLVLWLWLAYRAFDLVLDWDSISSLLGNVTVCGSASQTPRSTGTPFFPATPFASPNQHLSTWRSSSDTKEGG